MPELIKEQYLLIGHVARSHGVAGTVLIVPKVDDPALFDEIELIYLQNSRGDLIPARVKSARVQQKKSRLSFFVKFEHITDRNEAEALKSDPVYVEKHKVEHLVQKNHRKWISFGVLNENNEQIGTVEEVLDNPAHFLLQVSTESGNLLVPFVDEYIQSIDEENETICCKNLDQLKSLNDDAN